MADAIYNPHAKSVADLPVIYGFNNGGAPGFMDAVLMGSDGTYLGGHLCSHEFYMPGDLGILEGSRPDRHEGFRQHFPDGYRMEFVSHGAVLSHSGLTAALALNQEQAAKVAAATA